MDMLDGAAHFAVAGDNLRRNLLRLVSRVVEQLYIELFTRVVELAAGLDEAVDHVLLVVYG
jgi:hypothetical protein